MKGTKAFEVGTTMVAYGIDTPQRGVMANIDNAEQIINNWVDYMDERN